MSWARLPIFFDFLTKTDHNHTLFSCGEINQAGIGVGILPEKASSTLPFPINWLDTTESQWLLEYQCNTLLDYVPDLKAQMGFRRHLIWVFWPMVRHILLKLSAHHPGGRLVWFTIIMQGFKVSKGRPVRIKVG